MDIVYRRGQATASEVLSDLEDPPSYSAVRGMLRYLEEKGHLSHHQEGSRYVYKPTAPAGEVRDSALTHIVRTFFGGSVTSAVAALLSAQPPSPEEKERLARLLDSLEKSGGEE